MVIRYALTPGPLRALQSCNLSMSEKDLLGDLNEVPYKRHNFCREMFFGEVPLGRAGRVQHSHCDA